MKFLSLVACAAILMGCASTSVTPVARNQVIISTSAAPACGRSGSLKVANGLAAVETIRRGYERFMIQGMNSQNNVRVAQMPVTGANTSYNFNTYGSRTTGTAQTNYYGGGAIVLGSNDADIAVLMMNPGDAGFSNAIDAKQALGPDWQKLVENGIKTCL